MVIAVMACLESVPERSQEYMPTTGGKNNSEGPLQSSPFISLLHAGCLSFRGADNTPQSFMPFAGNPANKRAARPPYLKTL